MEGGPDSIRQPTQRVVITRARENGVCGHAGGHFVFPLLDGQWSSRHVASMRQREFALTSHCGAVLYREYKMVGLVPSLICLADSTLSTNLRLGALSTVKRNEYVSCFPFCKQQTWVRPSSEQAVGCFVLTNGFDSVEGAIPEMGGRSTSYPRIPTLGAARHHAGAVVKLA